MKSNRDETAIAQPWRAADVGARRQHASRRRTLMAATVTIVLSLAASAPSVAGCVGSLTSSSATATLTLDGVLLARYALGLRGAALVAGLRNPPLPSAIEATIENSVAALDYDGDGDFTPIDALIGARILGRFRGEALTRDIVFPPLASRKTPQEIVDFVDDDCPAQFGPLPGIQGNTPSDYPAPNAAEASRFLAHATFGPTEADIAALTQSTFNTWINAQFALPRSSPFQAVVNLQNQGYNINDGGNAFWQTWWTQAITGRDQLRQRLTFALSEIYVTSGQQASGGMAAYYDVLNRNAFGNLRTLLEEVSKNWQMGIYLTHAGNVKENASTGQTPDENYAREVMQLFSIGLWQLNRDGSRVLTNAGEPIPAYTQDDIRGMAKVFTGWVNPVCAVNTYGCILNTGWPQTADLAKPMVMWPDIHSTSEKKILGRTLPAGQSGQKDLADAIDTLFNHPNLCPFIGKLLIQRFTTSNPTREYVTRVTSACENDGSGKRGELKAMVRAILLDPDARSTAMAARSDWGKVREPVIKYAQYLRVFTGGSNPLYAVGNTDDVDYGLAQTPLGAPSVFNFFRADYAPQSVAARGLVAPEFQITNESTVAGNHNFMEPRITYGSDWIGVNIDRLYLPWLNIVSSDPTAFLNRLDLVLNAGRSTDATKQALRNMILATPASNPTKRLTDTLQVYFLTPGYLVQR